MCLDFFSLALRLIHEDHQTKLVGIKNRTNFFLFDVKTTNAYNVACAIVEYIHLVILKAIERWLTYLVIATAMS